MSFKKIDLADLCNHKLIYYGSPNPKREAGLDNIYIIKDVFLAAQRASVKSSVDVVFDYQFGMYDNIQCEGQRIRLNLYAEKIHLVGFAYWGDSYENVGIVYEDGTRDWCEVLFVDWSHPFDRGLDLGQKEMSRVEDLFALTSSGALTHLIYVHDCICELNKHKSVKEIVLPDNMLIHLFAVTVEYE